MKHIKQIIIYLVWFSIQFTYIEGMHSYKDNPTKDLTQLATHTHQASHANDSRTPSQAQIEAFVSDAEQGNRENVGRFIADYKPFINETDKQNRSALFAAIDGIFNEVKVAQCFAILEALLQAGADIKATYLKAGSEFTVQEYISEYLGDSLPAIKWNASAEAKLKAAEKATKANRLSKHAAKISQLIEKYRGALTASESQPVAASMPSLKPAPQQLAGEQKPTRTLHSEPTLPTSNPAQKKGTAHTVSTSVSNSDSDSSRSSSSARATSGASSAIVSKPLQKAHKTLGAADASAEVPSASSQQESSVSSAALHAETKPANRYSAIAQRTEAQGALTAAGTSIETAKLNASQQKPAVMVQKPAENSRVPSTPLAVTPARTAASNVSVPLVVSTTAATPITPIISAPLIAPSAAAPHVTVINTAVPAHAATTPSNSTPAQSPQQLPHVLTHSAAPSNQNSAVANGSTISNKRSYKKYVIAGSIGCGILGMILYLIKRNKKSGASSKMSATILKNELSRT